MSAPSLHDLANAALEAQTDYVAAVYAGRDAHVESVTVTRARARLHDAIDAEHHARLIAEGALAEARRAIERLREECRTAWDRALAVHTSDDGDESVGRMTYGRGR